MYIGELKTKKNIEFYHINSKIPFPPSYTKNGSYTWLWEKLFDTGVDISITLEQKCFIGAVNFTVPENCLSETTVLVNGSPAGYRTSADYRLFGGHVTVPVGVWGDEITIRLNADFQDIVLQNIEILGALDDDIPLVWPTPKSISKTFGRSAISKIIPSSDDADEIFVSQFLSETLTEKLGDWKKESGVTVIISKKTYADERYTIKYEEKTVTISAASRISLLYATDTLASMTDNEGVLLADIDDMPSKKLRGFHFGLPHRSKIEFTRRLLRYVLLPMRYNVIFLEFAGGMRFDSHPEISEGWIAAAENAKAGKQPFMPHSDKVSHYSLLEKDDVRLLVSYIKELGFALIPEVQSLAHVQYITYAHPELSEIDENTVEVDVREGADARPESFYAHCYCPSNPTSYKIIYDIIDEIVEITEPSGYVHIGHDEVYQIGLCEKCRNKEPSDLFADHVIALHDYLSKKGLRTMMWSDMLHPTPVTDYQTFKAAEKLPRDIVMLDFIWYFHPDKDIEDNLLSYGYKVAVGNLYSSHYTRFSNRIRKNGMIGGEVSMWLITDENILARNGKLWDVMYLSEMLWNTDGYNETNRKTYNMILSKYIQPATRDRLRGKYCSSGYNETELTVDGDDINAPSELLSICGKAKQAESIKVSVQDTYDRLIFKHTTQNSAPRIVWKENTLIGNYIIDYADGDRELAEVRYGEGAMCYKTGYAIPKHQQYYRHFGYVGTWFADPVFEGKNDIGKDITILGYVWENPYPEKKISRITYKSCDSDYCKLITIGIKGIKFKK